jgi:hypothetical protein
MPGSCHDQKLASWAAGSPTIVTVSRQYCYNQVTLVSGFSTIGM